MPTPVQPFAGLDLRVQLEEAAQTALDAADRIIAALDRLDGDADFEPDADAEPSLAAPEGDGSQVGWMRGGDDDREDQAGEIILPESAAQSDETPAIDLLPPAILPEPLRWYGAGNVVSAAGIAILALVARG